eukprot:3090421-Rhodomonas_salina.1
MMILASGGRRPHEVIVTVTPSTPTSRPPVRPNAFSRASDLFQRTQLTSARSARSSRMRFAKPQARNPKTLKPRSLKPQALKPKTL